MQQRQLRSRTHGSAESKYRLFREAVYSAVMESFPGIVADSLQFKDCLDADTWKTLCTEQARNERGSWSWQSAYLHYQNHPNRFEITLRASGVLCALCYGQTSQHHTRVRMNLIEATPQRPSPLGRRALPVVAFAASTFAELVGADEVWLIDPDPRLERLYVGEGFGAGERYHGKRMGQRRVL